ncbi:MAG: hypothetical protein ACRDZO_26855 [Egibacteraceae bacterium]
MAHNVHAAPGAVKAAAALMFASAVWAALLSVSHLGVEIPVFSGLGPGGERVILVPGVIFAVATAVNAVVAVGLLRLRSWAWLAGVVVNGLALLSGAGQFRGAGSVIGLLLAAAALAMLLAPQARMALRPQA